MHQCIKFILFWNDTLHVSDGLSVHHQQLKTVHTATGICQTDTAVCLLARLYSSICLVVSNLFWIDTLHVSDGLSVHHQQFKTVHTATGICQTETAVCFDQCFPYFQETLVQATMILEKTSGATPLYSPRRSKRDWRYGSSNSQTGQYYAPTALRQGK